MLRARGNPPPPPPPTTNKNKTKNQQHQPDTVIDHEFIHPGQWLGERKTAWNRRDKFKSTLSKLGRKPHPRHMLVLQCPTLQRRGQNGPDTRSKFGNSSRALSRQGKWTALISPTDTYFPPKQNETDSARTVGFTRTTGTRRQLRAELPRKTPPGMRSIQGT